MMKIDPIIAVKDVKISSKWYSEIFECKSIHGGDQFDVLTNKEGEVLICLHKWGEHEHPTMIKENNISENGLILYFRTDNLNGILEKLIKNKNSIEEDVNINPNTKKREFSLRDPDGYYLIISEYHKYEG